MLKRPILVYKPVAMTPLQRIQAYRGDHPELDAYKIGFAGRLDPMADGLLILLVGDQNKRVHLYRQLRKTYIVTCIFGISTDTYDSLGLIKSYSTKTPSTALIKKIINQYIGPIDQPPPPYSAYRIKGKPLFYYARTNTLHTITIPKIQREVYKTKELSMKHITNVSLHKALIDGLSVVKGEFRQSRIIHTWDDFFLNTSKKSFLMCQVLFEVSSGTYIRSIVEDIGDRLGIGAFCLKITRTRIGTYNLKEAEDCPLELRLNDLS